MSYLDQLNARILAKKQAPLTALDKVAKAAEAIAEADYALVQKYGVKGMKRGVRKPKDVGTETAPVPMSDKEKENVVALRQSSGAKPLPDAAKPKGVDIEALKKDGPAKKDLSKLARMEDNNNHGGVVEHKAKMLGRDDLVAEAKDINKAHEKAGSLTQDLYEKRNALREKINAHAKTLWPDKKAGDAGHKAPDASEPKYIADNKNNHPHFTAFNGF